MTYRMDPADEFNAPRNFTLDEISALLRKQYRRIPVAQYVAFTTLFPELASLFKDNCDES